MSLEAYGFILALVAAFFIVGGVAYMLHRDINEWIATMDVSFPTVVILAVILLLVGSSILT